MVDIARTVKVEIDDDPLGRAYSGMPNELGLRSPMRFEYIKAARS